MTSNPRYRAASWACRVALAVPLLAATPVWGETPAAAGTAQIVLQAEDYAARAFEAYARKDYAEAVALYQTAYDTAPSADALYNIARVYDLGLRDRPLAISAYRRYLSDPGASPSYIRVATARLAALREAELTLGATSSPPRPAPAPAAPTPARTDPAEDAGEAGPSTPSLRIAALIAGGAGIVSLGVGVGFGLRVLKDAGTANASCVDNRCDSQRGVDAARSASRHATVATVGVSAGLGLLATGAALWLASPREQPSPAALQLAPLTGTSELGLLLAGGF